MNIIKSLKELVQKLTRNKKIYSYLFIFLLIFLFLSDSTFAVDASQTSSGDMNELKTKIATGAEALLKGLSVLLALVTYLSTVFLSPEWINGTLFGMDKYFKEIWILVSNIVYFIFAFILIWIAFMNIIGKNAEQYQLKQALPKLIVGVLIVPFSWFLVQFILSISAILTVAALSLPFETFDSYKSSLKDVMVPKMCTLDLTSVFSSGSTDTKSATASTSYFDCPNKSSSDRISLLEVTGKGEAISSIFGVISMYTYGVLSLDTIGDLSKTNLQDVKTLGDLLVKIIFDVLFVFIYAILIIALGLVLMIRGIYIWIYMMISPVFGLMYFFGKEKEGVGDGFFKNFNVKEFISLAMVPVYTMLALSFGLLFFYIVGNGLVDSSKNDTPLSKVKITKDNEIKVGEFSLKIKGAVSTDENTTDLLQKFGNGALGIVGGLILKIFGIVILWGTVMAAMDGGSSVTKAVIEPLQQFGSSVGKIMQSGASNIPIFPGGVSATGMSQFGRDYSSMIDNKSVKTGLKLNEAFGLGNAELSASKSTLKNKLKQKNIDTATITAMRDTMEKFQTVDKMKSDSDFKEYVKEMAELLKVKLDGLNLNSSNDMAKALTLIDQSIEKDHRGKGQILNTQNIAYSGTLVDPKDIDKDLAGASSNKEVDSKDDVTKITLKTGEQISNITINKDQEKQIKALIVKDFKKDDYIEKLKGLGIDEDDAKTIAEKIDPKLFGNVTKIVPAPEPPKPPKPLGE